MNCNNKIDITYNLAIFYLARTELLSYSVLFNFFQIVKTFLIARNKWFSTMNCNVIVDNIWLTQIWLDQHLLMPIHTAMNEWTTPS